MSSAGIQLEALLSLIGTAQGVAGFVLAAAAVLVSLSRPWIVWAFLTIATLTAAFSLAVVDPGDPTVAQPKILAPPLEQIRANGRPLCVAALAAAVPFVLFGPKRGRRGGWARPLNIFLAILHVVIVVKYIELRLAAYAALSAVIYGGYLLVLGGGQTKLVPNLQDCLNPLRAIAAALSLFLLGTLYQAVRNADAMLGNSGRLQGMTNNPLHAAMLMTVALPAACVLWEIDRSRRWLRPAYGSVILITLAFTLWTGSRTALVMLLAGALTLYRRRIKLLLLGSAAAAAVVATLTYLQEGYGDTVNLLASTEDTRSHVWAAQWRGFERYPLFGAPGRGAARLGVGENSWLSAASSLGLAGLVPLIATAVAGASMCRNALKTTADVGGAQRRVAEGVVAGFVVILLGSVFEGYLLGVLNFQLFALLLYGAAGYAVAEGGGVVNSTGVVDGEPPSQPLKPGRSPLPEGRT